MNHAILLISCPDQKGINAAVTRFIFENNGNIVDADQHIDEQSNTFFMRIEWSLKEFRLDKDQTKQKFSAIADQFSMEWNIYFTDTVSRVAIFVSKPLHCLYDLLMRYKTGQLVCEIPLIISNHPEGRNVAKQFGVDYEEFPVLKENKLEMERRQLEVLRRKKIDLVVLARYHQVLTEQFLQTFLNRIINIHHSFLPAFIGKNPYLQAYEKGVKIIGATSHYVTEKLDEGPIIDQDTVRISHRDSLEDLIQKGQELERLVLFRAVRWHLEHKVLGYGNKTVVFG